MSRFVRRYSLYCSKTKGIYGKYSQFVLFFKLNIQTAFYVIISVDFQVTNSSNLTHKTNYSMSIMCKSFLVFFFTYAYNLQPGESVWMCGTTCDELPESQDKCRITHSTTNYTLVGRFLKTKKSDLISTSSPDSPLLRPHICSASCPKRPLRKGQSCI